MSHQKQMSHIMTHLFQPVAPGCAATAGCTAATVRWPAMEAIVTAVTRCVMLPGVVMGSADFRDAVIFVLHALCRCPAYQQYCAELEQKRMQDAADGPCGDRQEETPEQKNLRMRIGAVACLLCYLRLILEPEVLLKSSPRSERVIRACNFLMYISARKGGLDWGFESDALHCDDDGSVELPLVLHPLLGGGGWSPGAPPEHTDVLCHAMARLTAAVTAGLTVSKIEPFFTEAEGCTALGDLLMLCGPRVMAVVQVLAEAVVAQPGSRREELQSARWHEVTSDADRMAADAARRCSGPDVSGDVPMDPTLITALMAYVLENSMQDAPYVPGADERIFQASVPKSAYRDAVANGLDDETVVVMMGTVMQIAYGVVNVQWPLHPSYALGVCTEENALLVHASSMWVGREMAAPMRLGRLCEPRHATSRPLQIALRNLQCLWAEGETGSAMQAESATHAEAPAVMHHLSVPPNTLSAPPIRAAVSSLFPSGVPQPPSAGTRQAPMAGFWSTPSNAAMNTVQDGQLQAMTALTCHASALLGVATYMESFQARSPVQSAHHNIAQPTHGIAQPTHGIAAVTDTFPEALLEVGGLELLGMPDCISYAAVPQSTCVPSWCLPELTIGSAGRDDVDCEPLHDNYVNNLHFRAVGPESTISELRNVLGSIHH